MSQKRIHVNATTITLGFSGNAVDGHARPRQVLLGFPEDPTIRELPGITLYESYGKHSVMIPYDVFRELLVKVFEEVASVDGTFNEEFLEDDGEESSSGGGASNENIM
jgi:hypothetical protein